MRLTAFAGHWLIDRRIEDFHACRTGGFTGGAVFEPVADGLAYCEEGTLAFPGAAPMQATRRYLWRDGGAGAIDVLFADGRFFHRFDAGTPAPATRHDCPPDLYRVCYDFRAWPRWQTEWRVTGPRKDYAMMSSFTRQTRPERVAARGGGPS